MKMLFPPDLDLIRNLLQESFKTNSIHECKLAARELAYYYRIPAPTIYWWEHVHFDVQDKSAVGDAWGKTTSTGVIELTSPESWRKEAPGRGWKGWARIFFHEWYHYLYWVNDENKANAFARKAMEQ